MGLSHCDPIINKIRVATSLFKKMKMVSSTTAVVHTGSWSIYVAESGSQVSWKASLFFWLSSFQWKIFALTLFLCSSVPLFQHFPITSVVIGLFHPNLATLPELRSHSCEVPLVFITISTLECALMCSWRLHIKAKLKVQSSFCLAAVCWSLSTHMTLG